MIKYTTGFEIRNFNSEKQFAIDRKENKLFIEWGLFGRFISNHKHLNSIENSSCTASIENSPSISANSSCYIDNITIISDSSRNIDLKFNSLTPYDSTALADNSKPTLSVSSSGCEYTGHLIRPLTIDNSFEEPVPDFADYGKFLFEVSTPYTIYNNHITVNKKRPLNFCNINQKEAFDKNTSLSKLIIEESHNSNSLKKLFIIELNPFQLSNVDSPAADSIVSPLNFSSVTTLDKFTSFTGKESRTFDNSSISAGHLTSGFDTELRLASHSRALIVRMDVPELGKITARFGGPPDTVSMTLTSRDETGALSVAALQREMNLWLDQLNIDTLESTRLADCSSDNSKQPQREFPTQEDRENRRPAVTTGGAGKLNEAQTVSVERRPESESGNTGKWRRI